MALIEKNYEVSLLMDFYGEVLTEKQRAVVELYYNEDLSLAEIAEHTHITRQGVRDCVKRGEAALFDMERRLGLAKRFTAVRAELEQVIADAQEIAEYNERYCSSQKIADASQRILETARRLREE